MNRSLTWRLFACFTVALAVFVIATGGLFVYFFSRYNERRHSEEFLNLARTIAGTMRSRPETYLLIQGDDRTAPAQESAASVPGRRCRMGTMRRMAHHTDEMPERYRAASSAGGNVYCRRMFGSDNSTDKDNFSSEFLANYLKGLNELAHGEVWVVDAATRNFSLYGDESGSADEELPTEADETLRKIFAGETVSGRNFTPLLSAPSITAGAPIYSDSGAVIGALLVHRTLDSFYETQKDALKLLALCLAASLAAAAALSFALARQFVRPLKEMESFAGKLADGDYKIHSNIMRNDEIGSLSKSLDTLAGRLDDARKTGARLAKLRQDFLTNVSHELRTPVTVLRGILELFETGLVADEEKRRDYFDEMKKNVLGLQRLINDLFELTRLQNSDFTIEKTELDMMDPLRDAVRSIGEIARPREIAIIFPIKAEPVILSGDYGRLRQMFQTVLDNAVKFSERGGKIDVETARESGTWRVVIRDYGRGIRADVLPHIFDRFQSGREGNADGTGLGLPIARETARRHNITITCESVEGQGAAFIFTGQDNQEI